MLMSRKCTGYTRGLQMGFHRTFWKGRILVHHPRHLKPEQFRFHQFHMLGLRGSL